MKIGKKSLPVPMIQGGMGIGVSMGNLAGHVAKCGGMGVISTANIGFQSPHFYRSPIQANRIALMREIRKAQDLAEGKGLVAVNVMMATVGCDIQIAQAVNAGVDCIIAGAGLPTKLPEAVVGKEVAIAPIVSSAKALDGLCRYWNRRYNREPDFVIIEGPQAGGHLGFSQEELRNPPPMSEIFTETKAFVSRIEQMAGRKIPIFVAGGYGNRAAIQRALDMGADGVQVGTRFIATEECEASNPFKTMYVTNNSDNLQVLRSPVGMPGRAIRTNLLDALARVRRIPPRRCVDCISTCDPGKTSFCISDALIKAFDGNIIEGLFFAGTSIDDVKEIITVEALFDELMPSWRKL